MIASKFLRAIFDIVSLANGIRRTNDLPPTNIFGRKGASPSLRAL